MESVIGTAVSALERDGCAVVAPVFDTFALEVIAGACEALLGSSSNSVRRRAGVRGVVERSPALREVAASAPVRAVVERVLGGGAFLARSVLFDKTPTSNWDVPWHRDTTIAVKERREAPGFGPWSVKEGVVHVQPPVAVLEGMVTVRVHVDACPASNGALMVVPGSHAGATLDLDSVDAGWCEERARVCEVEAGGCLVMRPLILHASRKSALAGHRRVLHLEFAAAGLACGLEWAGV
jgi:ectoine hydroxylase-related dioxygenase (phytanoyl-CoA dioxygenase family)